MGKFSLRSGHVVIHCGDQRSLAEALDVLEARAGKHANLSPAGNDSLVGRVALAANEINGRLVRHFELQGAAVQNLGTAWRVAAVRASAPPEVLAFGLAPCSRSGWHRPP